MHCIRSSDEKFRSVIAPMHGKTSSFFVKKISEGKAQGTRFSLKKIGGPLHQAFSTEDGTGHHALWDKQWHPISSGCDHNCHRMDSSRSEIWGAILLVPWFCEVKMHQICFQGKVGTWMIYVDDLWSHFCVLFCGSDTCRCSSYRFLSTPKRSQGLVGRSFKILAFWKPPVIIWKSKSLIWHCKIYTLTWKDMRNHRTNMELLLQ